MLQLPVRSLQFHEEEWDTVHEPHQIGPTLVHLTGDPELGGEEEVVVFRLIPVDDPHRLDPLLGAGLAVADLHTVLDEPVNLTVRGCRAHGAPVAGQFIDC